MEDNRYNGWANYATWKIKLEYLDGDLDQMFDISSDTSSYHLAKDLEAFVNDYIEESGAFEYVLDLARCFLADVDWREIAEHLIEDAELEIEK
jgi:hypothetical protein